VPGKFNRTLIFMSTFDWYVRDLTYREILGNPRERFVIGVDVGRRQACPTGIAIARRYGLNLEVVKHDVRFPS